jgi:alpha-D-ribose 1-methylphosphonate 5-triphosphate synthase subunit PhnL
MIGFVLNLNRGKITFFKNGVIVGVMDGVSNHMQYTPCVILGGGGGGGGGWVCVSLRMCACVCETEERGAQGEGVKQIDIGVRVTRM